MTDLAQRTLRPPLPAPTAATLVTGAKLLPGSAQKVALVSMVAAIVAQPILHPTGPGNSSPVDVVMAAAIATAAIWATTSHHRLRAPYVLPVGVMIAAGAASGLHGPLPGLSLAALATDVLLLAWCIAVVNVLSAPRAMRCALVAWSWSSMLWAALVIVGWIGHISILEGLNAADGNRVTFTFGDPNYAAAYWVVSTLVVCAARCPGPRWARLLAYALLLWALVLTESNGGALSLGVGAGLLLVVRSHRRRGLVGAAAAVMALGLTVGALFTAFPLAAVRQWAADSGQSLLVNSIGRSGQSSSERSVLVSEIANLYERGDGVFGVGPVATKPMLATLLYPYSNEAHDDLLAALVERGVAGMFGLLLLVGTAARWTGPVVSRPLSAHYAAVVPRPAALAAALLALAVNSLYEEILHFRFLWMLLAILAVLGHDVRRRRC
jgi:hypothetical protein